MSGPGEGLLLDPGWLLEAGALVIFEAPEILWGLAALPLLALALSGEGSLAERARALGSVLLRLLAVAALVVAAARPVLLRQVPDVSLVLAIDRSASMSPARLAELRARASTLLGETPGVVEVSWGASPSVGEPPEPRPAARGTSLGPLLDLAAASAPSARSRRVLLLTDGAETEDEEALVQAAAAWGAKGVSFFPLSPAAPADNVGLRGLSWPAPVEAGGEVQARVLVEASAPGARRLALFLGDRELAATPLALREGLQEVRLAFRAPPPGTWLLEARVEGDGWPEDDRVGAWLVSRGEGPVLALGPHAAELSALLARQGLPARALEDWPEEVPEGATLFVLAPDMPSWPQTRPQVLRGWVRDRGVDLVLAGGPRGLGADGEWMEPLKRTLPVVLPRQNRREPPPLAVVYVIDRSDSMARAQKLPLALTAVEGSVALLPPEARVGVLAFSDDFEWAVPMMRARRPDLIRDALSLLTVSGGTRIYPALAEAWEALQATDALVRHVILLTDGAGLTRASQHMDLLRRIQGSSVTVSTVAVSAEADTADLRTIAELGHGRFHHTESLDDVPRIFVDETLLMMRRNAVEEDLVVRAMPGSPLAAGVDWSQAPTLPGRNEARAKATADLGLVWGGSGQPLLASWRSGLGSATVFTSQLGGGWGAPWMDWAPLGPWLESLIEVLRRRPPVEGLTLSLTPLEDGLEVTVQVLDAMGNPREDVVPELRLRGVSGERTVEPEALAPGLHLARADWDGPLLVSATVEAGAGSPAAQAYAGAAPPAPRELRGPMLDAELLRRVARASGGQPSPSAEQLLQAGVRAREERLAAWPWVIWLALAAWVADLLLRHLPARARPQPSQASASR